MKKKKREENDCLNPFCMRCFKLLWAWVKNIFFEEEQQGPEEDISTMPREKLARGMEEYFKKNQK